MTQSKGLFSISGLQVKFHRQRRGWTIGQLSERSGVSASLISRVETGKRVNVTAHTWQALAQALGVRPEDIADMERDVRPPIVSPDDLPPLETYLAQKYSIHLHSDEARSLLSLLVAVSKIVGGDLGKRREKERME